MPSIRIVSWNSTGENLVKAGEIQAVQAPLALLHPLHPNVDAFVVQEAANGMGGAIRTTFNTHPAAPPGTLVTIGAGYHRPCAHVPELMGGGGAAYLCAVRNALAVNTPLTRWNYAADGVLTAWIGTLPLGQQWAVNAVKALRPPVYTRLTTPGALGVDVVLITWHAPLGVSMIVPGVGVMAGGGLIDAYLILEQSNLLPWAAAQVAGTNGVVIIAGDLNATAGALAANYYGLGYNPLANFAGMSNHLDHILVWRPAGGGANVVEGHNTPSTSVHNILSARVTW